MGAGLVRQVGLLAPVGLKQDAVDLFEVDGFDAVAHGLEHGAEAEIFGPAQDSLGRADDEGERVVGEGGMSEGDLVELGADEVDEAVGGEFLHQGRVGDAVLDVLVDGQGEAAEQLGLCDEDEAVVFGEIFEEQADSNPSGNDA